MQNPTVSKEVDEYGSVYFRRIVRDDAGQLVSDERVKCDPMLVCAEPPSFRLDTGSADVVIDFRLYDFDGVPRTDDGSVRFRLRDKDVDDVGIAFTRQLVSGAVTVALEFHAAGSFVLDLDPPLVADMQLSQPVQIRIEQ